MSAATEQRAKGMGETIMFRGGHGKPCPYNHSPSASGVGKKNSPAGKKILPEETGRVTSGRAK